MHYLASKTDSFDFLKKIMKEVKGKSDNHHLTVIGESFTGFRYVYTKSPRRFKRVDTASKYENKYSFVNEEGKEMPLLATGHRVFISSNYNIPIVSVLKQIGEKALLIIESQEFLKQLHIAMQLIKEAQEADELEREYKKTLEKFNKELEEFKEKAAVAKAQIANLKEKLKVRATKAETDEDKAKQKAEVEELKKAIDEVDKPVKPEKPAKPEKHFRLLSHDNMKKYLKVLLVLYTSELKIFRDFMVIMPKRHFESSTFNRNHLLEIASRLKESITFIEKEEFKELVIEFLLKEDEGKKARESYFYTRFWYENAKFLMKEKTLAYLSFKEDEKSTDWDSVLKDSSNSEKEHQILAPLKPQQAASMLASGIGNYTKEINIGDESYIIKGAVRKSTLKREVVINNQHIVEEIDTTSQELGVLNLTRREFTIYR